MQLEQDIFTFKFIAGPQVEIRGKSGKIYNVLFIDNDTNQVIFSDNITCNHWTKCNVEYYKNWKIEIKSNGELVVSHLFKPLSNTLIMFESSALGDTISWMPYVEEFRKKHNVTVYCSTFHNKLFEKSYPEIKFVNRGSVVPDTRAVYRIGWFGKGEANNRNPNDCRTIPLQKLAADILGLEYQEIRSKCDLDSRAPLFNHSKYVVISTSSTAQAKYWNNVAGWQQTVNWLKSQGYEVINVGREPNKLQNVVDYCNVRPMTDIVNLIQYSQFFIGLGSGLSWLAWGLNKKVIMISGFSQKFCEFTIDNYRIINEKVCHGCFNDTNHFFNKSNWNWCPKLENTPNHFICTKSITAEMVINQIKDLTSEHQIQTLIM